MTEPIRCWTTSDPAYNAYHDEEWGRPVLDERGLYERLCLEGFQAGLAWITILRKRDALCVRLLYQRYWRCQCGVKANALGVAHSEWSI